MLYVSEPVFSWSNLDPAFFRILIIMKRDYKASIFVVPRSFFLEPIQAVYHRFYSMKHVSLQVTLLDKQNPPAVASSLSAVQPFNSLLLWG